MSHSRLFRLSVYSIPLLFILFCINIPSYAQPTGTVIINLQTIPADPQEFNFSSPHYLKTNMPGVGPFIAGYANFGPPLSLSGVTAQMQVPFLSGCQASDFAGFVPGRIAIIDRGNCNFTDKVINAQNAGAVGVIIVNNQPGQGIINMGGSSPFAIIPSIFISYEDGMLLKAELATNPGMLGTIGSELAGYFTLINGQSKTVMNLPAGTYPITQADYYLSGFELTSISITDPTPGSSFNLGTRSASIDLAEGETVVVTFTNTVSDGRCTIDPLTAIKDVNTEHSIKQTLIHNGVPYEGVSVTFNVISGPNTGETALQNIDANGEAVFTYTGVGGPGLDSIRLTVGGLYDCMAVVEWIGVCPLGSGAWKRTPWPVDQLVLGTQTYLYQVLMDILNMSPGTGNKADASIILAKQLISAKLNIENDARVEPGVLDSIISADNLISSNIIPMNTKANSPLGKSMISLAIFLDNYNNGLLSEGCELNKHETSELNEIHILPEEYSLNQNYPNPFNPVTSISWQQPVNNHVSLKIYDMLGTEIISLVDEVKAPGSYSVAFDASGLASGMYIYKIISGNFVSTKKMILMK